MLLSTLLSFVFLAPTAPAHEPGGPDAALAYLLKDLPGVPDDLRQAILAGDTQRALELVRQVEDRDATRAPFWMLIEGAILQQSGAHAAALTLLQQAETRAGAADPWLPKIRFARAASYRALGQWREAEALLEEETDRLRSAGRQSDLAAVVLEFADASSTPVAGAPAGAPSRDFAKARSLYQEVLAMEVLPETREYAQWRIAFCAAELGDWNGAVAACSDWLRAWDPSFEPGARPPLPPSAPVPERVFDVRFQLARAQASQGDARSAERSFLDLEAALLAFRVGGGPLQGRVPEPGLGRAVWLEELRGEAIYQAGVAAGAQGRRAQQIGDFARLLKLLPSHPRVAAAAFGIGEAEAAGQRWTEAIQAWDAFLARPRVTATGVAGVGLSGAEAVAADAELRMRASFRKADALFALGRYAEAGQAYERYTASFPTGADWAAAQEGVVRASYEIGADLMRARKWPEARAAWSQFLERHPLHDGARGTFFAIGELFTFEAEGKEPAAAAPLLEAAIMQWNDLAARWPRTEEASHALFAAGELLEDRLGRLDEAIAAYRRCDFGGWQGSAQARLARMLEEDLSIATTRAWRSGEKAKIRVDVRNLEELQVEIFPLDLEAYFRKHLSHEGVADLDLDLIAPAQKFSWKVPDYRRFAPLTREIELPLDGPGAWAVAISASDLRSTTLVLRTDLDLLVKSSREELLVLAEDMKRLHAAPEVRVVVAAPGAGEDGAPRLFELLTGADGVARLDWRAEGIAAPDDLRVYAASALGAAGTHLGLEGLGASAGLGARGHIATDRPAYRPGEPVRWRAVVRGVAADRWSFQVGEKWRVTLADPAGRLLSSSVQELSSFGTLQGSLPLEERAPPGAYQLRIAAPDGTAHAASFQVLQFELPKVRLDLQLGTKVAMRNESLSLRITAATWFGEPLPAANLTLSLPDGRSLPLVTDADGAANYAYDTAGAEEGQWLEFAVVLADGAAAAAARCYLAPTGFRAGVSVRRPLVLAGEAFPVELTATGWDGAPQAADLHLTVLRRERTAGVSGRMIEIPDTWSEKVVQEKDLRTDEKTGRVSVTLALEQGGEYRLRVAGVDAQQRPVTAEARLEVSGEQDQQKLRFLTDLTEVQVGAETELRLNNRAGPGLALVTFLGAGVIEYRVVHLAEGANMLRFTARPEFWPNFAIAVDLMREREWHATQLALRAGRAMHVTLKPARATWRPGEEAEVQLEATDQLGRPVEAEFAIGVVDESLFAIAPDATPALEAHFLEGVWRQAEMRTAATSLFSYAGGTRFVAQEILDEALAQEAAVAWDRRRQEVEELLAYKAADGDGVRYGAPAAAPAAPQADAEAQALGMFFEDALSGQVTAGGAGGGAGGQFGGRRGGKLRGGLAVREGDLGEALAYWNGSVRTDAQGRATVHFKVPPRSTSWRLQARGVGPDNLLGETAVSQLARADFLVELRSPAFVREGDRPSFGALVHNLTGMDGEAKMELKLDAANGHWRVAGLARFADGARSATVEFATPPDLTLPPGGSIEVEVLADGRFGGNTVLASAQRSLNVVPWGTAFTVARAGVLTAEESFELVLPPAYDWRNLTLELRLANGLDEMLIEEALRANAPLTTSAGRALVMPAGVIVPDIAAALIGVCAVMESVEGAGQAAGPDHGALRATAANLAASLAALQGADGGWPWCAGGGASAGESTARSLWALNAAQERGVAIAPQAIAGAIGFVQEALRRTPSHALEETAMYLHALTRAGAADFALANRLHRSRQEMNVAALAYTTLALARQNSGPMAAEVAEVLSQRYVAGQGWRDVKVRGWHRNPAELTALALMAMQASPLRTSAIPGGVADLMKMRPWPEPSARGLAVAALAVCRQGALAEATDAVVEASVGALHTTIRLERGKATLPWMADAAARTTVRLTLRGRGQPAYVAQLSGFTRALIASEDDQFSVQQHKLLAAPPVHAGREIQTGFGVLDRVDAAWQNEVRQLPLGESLIGSVAWNRDWRALDEDLDADYLLLEVPLPAGARLVPGSVVGSIESWEERDGSLFAWLGRTRNGGVLNYRLAGSVPGVWRVPPPVLRSAYAPGRSATGAAGELTVLARGARSTDAYRPTPDELFHLGQALYQEGDLEGASAQLQSLVDQFERRLDESALRATAEMLLYCGIARNQPQQIVRWFEVLKEKSPELTIPFAQVVTVGRAYRALGEYERASLVFLAVLEETFGKDLRVAGVLEGQGNFAGAMDALYRLWLEYPDLPTSVSSALTLADRLLLRAPEAHLDPALARAGLDRAGLIGAGVRVLRLFQSLYPQDPLAADAGLDLVSAHLGLQNYADAAARAGEMARRFPEPHWADTFGYSEAVAAWYLGRDDDARALLQRIADAVYADAGGGERPSENHDLALYILGQICHARKDFAAATGYYEKVANVFADAREALATLREKRLALDEVSEFRPGEPVQITLRHRNLETAEVLAYPVDLMTLYLRERNLSGVTGVNLSGIEPALRRSISLSADESLRPQETQLSLELTEPGAYLVMVRGGELHASGLVLISDVELEVREDAVQGRLRVQAAARSDGAFLRDVDVRVIGSGNDRFVTGRTDPRGIFVADGIAGASTVIARWHDAHYAFFRGQQALGQVQQEQNRPGAEGLEQLDANDYLSNVYRLNADKQSSRSAAFEKELRKDRKGVRVLQVK